MRKGTLSYCTLGTGAARTLDATVRWLLEEAGRCARNVDEAGALAPSR